MFLKDVIKSLEEKIEQLEQDNKTLQKNVKQQERSDSTMKELIEKVKMYFRLISMVIGQ